MYKNGSPLYKQIYVILKKRIQEGVYPPGTLLPTEAMIEEEFGVSRTTVRNAIALLSTDGYIQIKQGRGTEVLDISTTQKLNGITSITETLQKQGYKVTTQGMHIEENKGCEYICEALCIDANTPYYKIQRVQCADAKPVAIITNYIKKSIAPNLDKHVDTFFSLYAFLEEKYHIYFKEGVEYLSAINATFEESQILQVPVGTSLLYSKRTISDETGPFIYDESKLIASKYEYCIFLKNRNI